MEKHIVALSPYRMRLNHALPSSITTRRRRRHSLPLSTLMRCLSPAISLCPADAGASRERLPLIARALDAPDPAMSIHPDKPEWSRAISSASMLYPRREILPVEQTWNTAEWSSVEDQGWADGQETRLDRPHGRSTPTLEHAPVVNCASNLDPLPWSSPKDSLAKKTSVWKEPGWRGDLLDATRSRDRSIPRRTICHEVMDDLPVMKTTTDDHPTAPSPPRRPLPSLGIR